ncbi:hypothetical protein CSB45_05635 [candidate division KSB3 bacterium]|uniref:CheW-like domain-containing protein n=1 Tax=candidate division KSB3 bacterium TaxID=2044937 RepID=A0A2G6E6K0_9BACT|nr:MAG: hypothetical protein CSB45_05635 [candidate division KSB3 bacterium]PIE30136.1 MAG: hypothetical protein CSA57_04345 [candidate division KSB3 bacterium]
MEHEQDLQYDPEDAGQAWAGEMDVLEALEETDSPEAEKQTRQIILVTLDKGCYGIEISLVQEVLKVPKITWLPCCPDYIAGVISLRGNIQSVVNLKAFFQLAMDHVTEQSRILLVESGELIAGLLVDEMLDILDVKESSIRPFSGQAAHIADQYVEGEFYWNDQIVTILHVPEIVEASVVDQQ